MNNRIMGAALILALLCLGSRSSWAGAWARQDKEIYSKLSYSQFTSDEQFAAKGNNKIPGPDFEENTVSVYTEYGLTSSWTGILQLSHKSLSYDTTSYSDTESGFGDVWLYGKKQVLSNPFIMSVQLGAKFPLGYDEKNIPPLGKGQIDVEPRLLVGRSLNGISGYWNSEIGYRKRMGDYSDEIPYLIEVGVHAGAPILFKVVYEGISNLTNDAASKTANRHPNVFDQEYAKLMPGLIFSGKSGWALDIYYETIVSGGNTASGDGFGIGVSWQGRP